MRTIAWDVDDVLNDLMREWFEQQWRADHPDCSLRYEDLVENPPHRTIGTDLAGYQASLDAFRRSPAFPRMRPDKEVLDWFRAHGQRFRHVALTAVPLFAAPATADWVLRHFGQWVRTFHFVPTRRPDLDTIDYDRDKGDFLQWLGKADVLVDDRQDNLLAAERVGVKGLAPPKPWNGATITLVDQLAVLAA